MSVKDDDAALLTQGKEEDAGRQKIDRKDGLVFKLSDYNVKTPPQAPANGSALCTGSTGSSAAHAAVSLRKTAAPASL